MLESLDIDGKDLRVVRNIYWEQTATIKIENEISPSIKVNRRVRQGCVFSPDLFNLYSENILGEIQYQAGILIGGHNLNNIRYADDIVLIADSEENLQKILDNVVSESESKRPSINCKKTECLVVSKQETRPTCNVTINNEEIKQVDKIEYLDSLITFDAKCDQEINRRIRMAKAAFQKMKKLLCNSKLALKTKLRVLECYVISILIYSFECWTISENMKKKIEATELWFLRPILKFPWTSYTNNEEVLKRSGSQRKLFVDHQKKAIRILWPRDEKRRDRKLSGHWKNQ